MAVVAPTVTGMSLILAAKIKGDGEALRQQRRRAALQGG